jgi:hypothetical protein
MVRMTEYATNETSKTNNKAGWSFPSIARMKGGAGYENAFNEQVAAYGKLTEAQRETVAKNAAIQGTLAVEVLAAIVANDLNAYTVLKDTVKAERSAKRG